MPSLEWFARTRDCEGDAQDNVRAANRTTSIFRIMGIHCKQTTTDELMRHNANEVSCGPIQQPHAWAAATLPAASRVNCPPVCCDAPLCGAPMGMPPGDIESCHDIPFTVYSNNAK
jgi:hypothetical protein